MNKTIVDIGYGDIDIYVYGELVLHIGQVSDEEIINLFLYPKGDIIRSLINEDDPDNECTHEILKKRVNL